MITLLAYELMKVISGNLKDFKCTGFIGRKSTQGLIYTEHGKYSGLTDKLGNYFYIRYENETSTNTVARRFDSCVNTYLSSNELKLVAVFSDYSPDVVRWIFMQLLMIANIDECYKRFRPEIVLGDTSIDQERILIEEVVKVPDSWNESLKLASIKFNLTYYLSPDQCACFDPCIYPEFDAYLKLRTECSTLEKILANLS